MNYIVVDLVGWRYEAMSNDQGYEGVLFDAIENYGPRLIILLADSHSNQFY